MSQNLACPHVEMSPLSFLLFLLTKASDLTPIDGRQGNGCTAEGLLRGYDATFKGGAGVSKGFRRIEDLLRMVGRASLKIAIRKIGHHRLKASCFLLDILYYLRRP
jgi:hypothetical protein